MHEPAGSDDFAAEMVADGLVAEANAEDRFFPGEGADNCERHTGFGRRTGAGREEDAVGVERKGLGRGDLVVAVHTLRHAQLPEALDEVIGEGVEVVDDEQHGG